MGVLLIMSHVQVAVLCDIIAKQKLQQSIDTFFHESRLVYRKKVKGIMKDEKYHDTVDESSSDHVNFLV